MHPTAEQLARQKAISEAIKPLKLEIERLWKALKLITRTEKGFDSNRDIDLMRKGKYRR